MYYARTISDLNLTKCIIVSNMMIKYTTSSVYNFNFRHRGFFHQRQRNFIKKKCQSVMIVILLLRHQNAIKYLIKTYANNSNVVSLNVLFYQRNIFHDRMRTVVFTIQCARGIFPTRFQDSHRINFIPRNSNL